MGGIHESVPSLTYNIKGITILERTKYCCDGQHAVLVQPLFPMERKGVKFYTAIYECKKCGSLTLRGETNQLKTWNTFVEFITPEKVRELSEEKNKYEMARRSDEEVRPA